jgi:transposase-like protein
MDKDIFIIECPECGAKNRIKSYSPDRIPVCAKCRARLVDEDENEAHSRYTDNLKNFYNLPDMNARDSK